MPLFTSGSLGLGLGLKNLVLFTSLVSRPSAPAVGEVVTWNVST